jgi:hypothetical protein
VRGACGRKTPIFSSPSIESSDMTKLALRGLKLAIGAAACLAAVVPPGLANDSAAELSVGGLVFTRSPDVAMESEDLAITPEFVTVKYKFRNQSAAPVTLTVAFPLPDIDLAEADNYAFPAGDPDNFVGFETKVDGKPVPLTMNQRAMLGNKDVSATLRAAGVALLPIGPNQKRLSELAPATREKLVGEGLLAQSGSDERGRPIYEAAWTVKMSAVREQTFPPNRVVSVEHRYRTSLGGSTDTVLRKGLRRNKAMEKEVERYRKQYCVTDGFLASLDKMGDGAEANVAKLREWRISYVLKTGANWAGPIKAFRLVVDKGKAERIVSFCAPNMKVLSPTQVEVTATDFTPDKDLKILIVGRN